MRAAARQRPACAECRSQPAWPHHRSGRNFLALFFFGLYTSSQIKVIPWWDVVGANGVANTQTVTAQLAFGVAAFICGYVVNLRKANA
jgi:hypothetical protein